MFRYNYHPLKNKERSTLIFLILFSALIRVPIILTLGDAGLEHEWKAIMESLTKHGVFSSKNFDGFLIPNLFMYDYLVFLLFGEKYVISPYELIEYNTTKKLKRLYFNINHI